MIFTGDSIDGPVGAGWLLVMHVAATTMRETAAGCLPADMMLLQQKVC